MGFEHEHEQIARPRRRDVQSTLGDAASIGRLQLDDVGAARFEVGQLRVQTALQIHLHGIDERTARPMRVVRLQRHATTLQSIDPERPRSDELASPNGEPRPHTADRPTPRARRLRDSSVRR